MVSAGNAAAQGFQTFTSPSSPHVATRLRCGWLCKPIAPLPVPVSMYWSNLAATVLKQYLHTGSFVSCAEPVSVYASDALCWQSGGQLAKTDCLPLCSVSWLNFFAPG